MHHQLREFADDAALARAAAAFVAQRAQEAVAAKGTFAFAVSGGRTPWAMFAELASCPMPWSETVIYQVDERVAPLGDESRNLTNLKRSLGDARPDIKPMGVNEADLERAADEYARLLPERFDLVHLGLGPDGHTASLFPGSRALDEKNRWVVAVTKAGMEPFVPRVTLTFPALASTREMLFLVDGAGKRDILQRVFTGEDLPGSRAYSDGELVWLLDRAAAPETVS